MNNPASLFEENPERVEDRQKVFSQHIDIATRCDRLLENEDFKWFLAKMLEKQKSAHDTALNASATGKSRKAAVLQHDVLLQVTNFLQKTRDSALDQAAQLKKQL